MNTQQEYFKKLTQNTHPTDIKIALNQYDSKTGTYKPGRRYNADKYELHDERNVAENEIIFDLDWKSYKANYSEAKKIIEALTNNKIPHITCSTGGKGIHIHTFFNKINFVNEEQKNLFKKALSYHFTYKNIRLWVWNKILDEAGIDERYRGKGKQVDSAPMIFNYYAGTTHLIRDVGGRKYVKNNEGEFDTAYKSVINKDEFKPQKPNIKRIEDVRYPETIPLFDIDPHDLTRMLKEFVSSAENRGEEPLTKHHFEGRYTELDGVLRVREGQPEGRRSAGAAVISIASKLDGLPKKECKELLEEYVLSCEQSGTPFSNAEAEQWMEWIYNHEKPYWNCQLLRDLESHEEATCNFCKGKNKDALKLLTDNNILKKVKDVLDDEIIGEEHTKMLIFLLSLSKDFPSKTGSPGWNITGDPMSQNIILSSDSSSGKSYITKKILELLGDEGVDYFIVSRITKNALNYYTEINMDGKVIFIEELQGLDENTAQLRVWMSEGSLNLSTVEKVKDPDGLERNVEVRKTTRGQPVFISNQAESVVETQLNNRSWVISADVSKDQTQNILDFQDKVNTGRFTTDEVKKRNIRDAIKLLKPYHFIITYADNKYLNIPVTDVRSRRDYQKFLTLIKCSAYLHQQQRLRVTNEKEQTFIICNLDDYEVAKTYSQDILGATFSGLTNAQIDLINFVKGENWVDGFEISDLMRRLGKSQGHWFGMLKQLVDLGFFTEDKQGVGRSNIYHLMLEKAVNIINLPTKEELLAKMLLPNNELLSLQSFLRVEQPSVLGVFEKSLLGHPVKPSDSEVLGGSNLIMDFPDTNKEFFDTPPIKNTPHLQGEKIIRSGDVLTKEQIINHLNTINEQIVPYETIRDVFISYGDDVVYATLLSMKQEGLIYEPKPGRYMIL